MPKQICLITGATDGVGKETASELAKKGFTVVLVARNAAKAEMVAREIAQSTGATDVDYILCDLGSLTQVRQLAETFSRKYPRLDVLINNAGIFAPQRMLTEDGYEKTYQVNYLSHFLLTHLLLEDLKRSGQGRIINLSSSVYNIGKFDPGNLQSEQSFSLIGAYAASKLLILMFTLELAERLRGARVVANAVHPGVVRTQMLANATGVFKIISYFATPFAVSPQQGASTSVYLASSPQADGVSGHYFVKSRAANVKSRFNTAENRKLLWDLSVQHLQQGG
jgi:NAD(P)-dependent dehydrogenase (short-subunit alcohol dehydrogenase family)